MKEMEGIAFDILKSMNISTNNTILAESSCPDELNHDSFSADLFDMMGNRWGEVFHLGGLAGIPFTGSAGWGAFSHHVPDNGNILVVFAPHVGLTREGVVGKVHRPGQDHATSACGAAVGAYKYLKDAAAELSTTPDKKSSDFQQQFIIDELRSRMDAINAITDADGRQAKLAHETYELVKRVLNDIMDSGWMGPDSKLILLGGLMINIDGSDQDYFEPLEFSSTTTDGTTVNLLQ